MQKLSCKSYTLNQHLLDRFNQRDEEAFCFVYEDFYNELYYFASKLFSEHTVLPYDVTTRHLSEYFRKQEAI